MKVRRSDHILRRQRVLWIRRQHQVPNRNASLAVRAKPMRVATHKVTRCKPVLIHLAEIDISNRSSIQIARFKLFAKFQIAPDVLRLFCFSFAPFLSSTCLLLLLLWLHPVRFFFFFLFHLILFFFLLFLIQLFLVFFIVIIIIAKAIVLHLHILHIDAQRALNPLCFFAEVFEKLAILDQLVGVFATHIRHILPALHLRLTLSFALLLQLHLLCFARILHLFPPSNLLRRRRRRRRLCTLYLPQFARISVFDLRFHQTRHHFDVHVHLISISILEVVAKLFAQIILKHAGISHHLFVCALHLLFHRLAEVHLVSHTQHVHSAWFAIQRLLFAHLLLLALRRGVS
mmetsp:Transcript_72284/g.115251  ORF Transcript_72284/g.115251 Transcript_72284/m.115251 type:complete len:345 (+) Transcript_72284:1217-2251(+)